jgi:hypothetical protein
VAGSCVCVVQARHADPNRTVAIRCFGFRSIEHIAKEAEREQREGIRWYPGTEMLGDGEGSGPETVPGSSRLRTRIRPWGEADPAEEASGGADPG